jgi:hypothetical protein
MGLFDRLLSLATIATRDQSPAGNASTYLLSSTIASAYLQKVGAGQEELPRPGWERDHVPGSHPSVENEDEDEDEQDCDGALLAPRF